MTKTLAKIAAAGKKTKQRKDRSAFLVHLSDEKMHPALLGIKNEVPYMTPIFNSEKGLMYVFGATSLEKIRDELSVYNSEEIMKDFPERTYKRNQYEVHIREETVTIKTIELTIGRNHHSNEPYQSYKAVSSFIFSVKQKKNDHRILRSYSHQQKTRKHRGHFYNNTSMTVGSFGRVVNSLYNLPASNLPASNLPEVNSLAESILWEESFASIREGKNSYAVNLPTVAQLFAIWSLYRLLKFHEPDHPALPQTNFFAGLAYPALALFPDCNVDDMYSQNLLNTKNFGIEPDIKQFISKHLGKKNVRKDVIKAILKSNEPSSVFLVSALNRTVPIEWLLPLLESGNESGLVKAMPKSQNVSGFIEDVEDFFSKITLPQRQRLLKKTLENQDGRWVITDTIRQYRLYSENDHFVKNKRNIDFTNWRTLHDSVTRIVQEITHPKIVFDKSGTFMEILDKTSYQFNGCNYDVVAPADSYMLSEWGQRMGNCIGSYGSSVQGKHTNLFAVYKSGEMFGNVELSNDGRLNQYYARHNSNIPQDEHKAFLAHFEAKVKESKEKLELEAAKAKEETESGNLQLQGA